MKNFAERIVFAYPFYQGNTLKVVAGDTVSDNRITRMHAPETPNLYVMQPEHLRRLVRDDVVIIQKREHLDEINKRLGESSKINKNVVCLNEVFALNAGKVSLDIKNIFSSFMPDGYSEENQIKNSYLMCNHIRDNFYGNDRLKCRDPKNWTTDNLFMSTYIIKVSELKISSHIFGKDTLYIACDFLYNTSEKKIHCMELKEFSHSKDVGQYVGGSRYFLTKALGSFFYDTDLLPTKGSPLLGVEQIHAFGDASNLTELTDRISGIDALKTQTIESKSELKILISSILSMHLNVKTLKENASRSSKKTY